MTGRPLPPDTSGTSAPRRLRDRLLLRGLGLLPSPLARHLLFLLRSYPALADRWGFHIRPVHFYEPLPDFTQIRREATTRRREFTAIDFSMPSQLALFRRLGARYRRELEAVAAADGQAEAFNFHNEYFAGLDAAVYYALVRDLKPARITEIGSGFSTRIAHLALQRNRAEGRPGAITCIEPYPDPRLDPCLPYITLVRQRVEDLPLERFDDLESGDILFIDSSHAVKHGGDVCRELLEILPRLKAGVWIHVHDIFFPHDYPAEWLIERRYAFTEQYMLEAFLAFNASFSVEAANYLMSLQHPEVTHELCAPALMTGGIHGRASFWMKKVA